MRPATRVILAAVAFGGTLAVAPRGAPASELAYRIAPKDVLAVVVQGSDALSGHVTVLPTGEISYPLVGAIHVAGDTTDEAAVAVASRLRRYVRDPVVTISVVTAADMRVLVLGDVKSPGSYEIAHGARVTDALAAAGGLNPMDGSPPDARITNATGMAQSVSLTNLLHNGRSEQDVTLTDGDVVYVPGPLIFHVNVSGAVDHPGDVALREGDGVSAAVAKAGDSANAQADLNHVEVIRRSADGQSITYRVNLYAEWQKSGAKDFPLDKGDVVYVPKARKGATSIDYYNVLSGLRLFFPYALIP